MFLNNFSEIYLKLMFQIEKVFRRGEAEHEELHSHREPLAWLLPQNYIIQGNDKVRLDQNSS